MHRARGAGARRVALVLVAGLIGWCATLAPGQGTLEGRHAVAQVDQAHYVAVHSDLLYTRSGCGRLWEPEHDLARDNIQALLASYGLVTTLEPFDYWGTYYNVIGELPGTTRPSEIYIIGAHYDSAAFGDWEFIDNPGADDNATGVAAILEIARLVSQWQSEATIRFVAFDREEQWMIGSYAYAGEHATDDIRGMLALDMLAYPRFGPTAEIYGEAASDGVKYALADALIAYTDIQPIVQGPTADDHIPFEELGFQAALFIEPDPWGNPYIHTLQDSLDTGGYIDYSYATALTRGVMGWLVDAAGVTPKHPAGDMNCDGTVDPADINLFVLALTDPDAYAATYPDCHWLNADCNGNGTVDFADINPLVAKFYAPCSGPQAAARLWSAEAPNDVFGTSVAISGDMAAIGSNADDIGAWSGAVLVAERVGEAWATTALITSTSGQEMDAFGRCVALDGGTLLIGAPGDSDVASYAGAAYVYERIGGTWTQTAKLTTGDGAAEDHFGWAGALNGDVAVIGAPGVDGVDLDQGAAYVFHRTGGVWIQMAKLVAPDEAGYDNFGFSVAVRGQIMIVGAIGHDSARGAAYVLEWGPRGWSQTAKLTAADGVPDDQFGCSVGVDGDIAVAAGYRQVAGVRRTSAYAYRRTAGVWSQSARLGTWGGTWGATVAVEGQTIVVGRDGGDIPSGTGAVYVFALLDGKWSQVSALAPWDGENGGRFGSAVALGAGRAVIGAPLGFVPPSAMGSAYVFELSGSGTPWIAQQPNDQDADAGSAVSFAVSAVGPGELSFRWFRNGQRLSDNERISGATTATLTIDPVQPEDAGVYQASVSSLCGSIGSDGAILTVTGRAFQRSD